MYKILVDFEDGVTLPLILALLHSEENVEFICVYIFEVNVVLDELPWVEVRAAKDTEHQDLYGQNKELASYKISLAAPAI